MLNMTRLHYAKNHESKTVYAFLSAERCNQQVAKLNLVPVTSKEARKLFGKPPRQHCTDWTWKSKINGFALPVLMAKQDQVKTEESGKE
jgi:hypothetical protein